MAKAMPVYLVEQVTTEVRLATRQMLTARSVRRSLASQNGCRVNVGCGKNPIQGWINLDVVSYPGVYFWDCRSGLPFEDGTVTAIYSEHFFEHDDLETEARPFLRECLRLGWVYQTKMQFMNAIFRQRTEHKYAYDAETLVLVMREAGFVDVVVQEFGVSIDSKMVPDSNDRRTESLYVEAVKR